MKRKINVKLLRKVAKHISEEPNRLAMSRWLQRDDGDSKVLDPGDAAFPVKCRMHSFARCGTAACIAGWAAFLHDPTVNAWAVSDRATKLLGLQGEAFEDPSESESARLFFVRHWPTKYRVKYTSAKTPRGKASAAVARIEHFIKTKGAE